MTADLILGEQRVPDGSRPLVVGRTSRYLEPAVATVQLRCFVFSHARRYELAIPADCRRTIEPGEHYLAHHQYDGNDVFTGYGWAYCAPCAIREAEWWDVHEAGAA